MKKATGLRQMKDNTQDNRSTRTQTSESVENTVIRVNEQERKRVREPDEVQVLCERIKKVPKFETFGQQIYLTAFAAKNLKEISVNILPSASDKIRLKKSIEEEPQPTTSKNCHPGNSIINYHARSRSLQNNTKNATQCKTKCQPKTSNFHGFGNDKENILSKAVNYVTGIDIDSINANKNNKGLSNVESNVLRIQISDDTTGSDIRERSKSNSRESVRSKDSEVDVICSQDFDFNDEFSFEDVCMDDFNDLFEEENHFEKPRRCKIKDIKYELHQTILTVKYQEDKDEVTVVCCGVWKDLCIKIDACIVIMEPKRENNTWVIDNEKGFIIVHPDILVSSTTVTSTIYCKRKAILQDKFRMLDSIPWFQSEQTAMIIGTLTHEWLQQALHENVSDLSRIIKILDSILHSKDNKMLIYALKMSIAECKEKMMEYAPRVQQFILHYFQGKRVKDIEDMGFNFKGRITKIKDIEQNIWLPDLGLKGRLDLNVEVEIHNKRKTVPLEIKTGRPNLSIEHKGQVILYMMMMAFTGQNTDTGLLLYLKNNTLVEIQTTHVEKRDLILLRNSIVEYLSMKQESNTLNPWSMPLPEPTSNRNACDRCPYNTICSIYLNEEDKLPMGHPLINISKNVLDTYSLADIEYVTKWIKIIGLEEEASLNKPTDLWTKTPKEREEKGMCITNLRMSETVVYTRERYLHKFVREEPGETGATLINFHQFTEGTYVVLGTDQHTNITIGQVQSANDHRIQIYLDKNLTAYNSTEKFHISKYSSNSFTAMNLANIGGLLADNETSNRLRSIIIHRKTEKFKQPLNTRLISALGSTISNLNRYQKHAVITAATTIDYLLIKGMPGTGKTQTIVTLIKVLFQLGQSVLITANSNSAVDNILLKLLDDQVDFLRLGSMYGFKEKLDPYSEKVFIDQCTQPEKIDKLFSHKQIVAATCYGTHNPLLRNRVFDVCIVDEGSQVFQPTVLRALYSAKKFILAGDPKQLPPIVRSKQAISYGGSESLFARLNCDNNTVTLNQQYRMNKCIMDLANKLTYSNELVAGSSEIEQRVLRSALPNDTITQEKWLRKVLSDKIHESVICLDTGNIAGLELNPKLCEKYKSIITVCTNIWEAAIISCILKHLKMMNISESNIGIIAPYTNQVNLCKNIFDKEIECNTVDQYQGRDKDVIIYTCTKSRVREENRQHTEEGILDDHRRLTVAVTRPKIKLIIIGDKECMMAHKPFQKLFELIDTDRKIVLNADNDFAWDKVLHSK